MTSQPLSCSLKYFLTTWEEVLWNGKLCYFFQGGHEAFACNLYSIMKSWTYYYSCINIIMINMAVFMHENIIIQIIVVKQLSKASTNSRDRTLTYVTLSKVGLLSSDE